MRAAKGERLRVHTDERTTTTQPQHTHKATPTHLLEADVVGVLTEAAAADHHRVLADNACNTVQQQRELAGNDSQTGTSILGMRTHSHTHTCTQNTRLLQTRCTTAQGEAHGCTGDNPITQTYHGGRRTHGSSGSLSRTSWGGCS